jgi:hypothetical protein
MATGGGRQSGTYVGGSGWLFVCPLLVALAGCDVFHRWEGLVYRNRHDLGDVIEIGPFDSLESCRAAARERMRELKIGEIGGYVCGENCMVKDGFSPLRMCARTAR